MQEIVLKNFHLIQVVVSQYRYLATETITADDLFQVACMGLMQAVQKFDPRRGVKFCTYAVVSMKRQCRRALDNHSGQLRISVHLQSQMRRARGVAAQLAAGGREPTSAELAAGSGLTERQLDRLAHLPRVVASLDEPTGDKELSTLGERFSEIDPSDPDERLNRGALIAFLQTRLSPRHYLIFSLFYGLDHNHPGGLDKRTIAQRLGVTRQAIEQSLERSKELLRTRSFGLLEKML